jgi:hypothetical protein
MSDKKNIGRVYIKFFDRKANNLEFIPSMENIVIKLVRHLTFFLHAFQLPFTG